MAEKSRESCSAPPYARGTNTLRRSERHGVSSDDMTRKRGIDDLFAAACNGDLRAENELFSRLRARIFDSVQYMIWDSSDAADIVQEIMAIILAKYKATVLPKGLLPWVRGIIRNTVRNYTRTVKRGPIRLSEQIPQDEREDPNRILMNKELQEIIERALHNLNQKHKKIMRVLLEGEIKSYIAKHCRKTPPGTIYADIHRCRKRFIELLKREGYEIEMR